MQILCVLEKLFIRNCLYNMYLKIMYPSDSQLVNGHTCETALLHITKWFSRGYLQVMPFSASRFL